MFIFDSILAMKNWKEKEIQRNAKKQYIKMIFFILTRIRIKCNHIIEDRRSFQLLSKITSILRK